MGQTSNQVHADRTAMPDQMSALGNKDDCDDNKLDMKITTIEQKKKKKSKKTKKTETNNNDDDDFDLLLAAETKTKTSPEVHCASVSKNKMTDQGIKSLKESSMKKNDTYKLEKQDNSLFRRLGDWPAAEVSFQSFPPSIPIHEIYSDQTYPEGEVSEYVGSNAFRMTDSEKKELDRLDESDLMNLRRAAECHRQTRKYAQSFIRPGMKMIDICQNIDRKSSELIAANGLESGWAFPTGCSLNNIAAHYTPNYGDETVLKQNDICKLDFGVHVSGKIIDCAFSIAFDPKFDPLIQATQDGTNTGLKCAGIDVPFSEIGTAIHEAIESYEMEIDGRAVPIVPIANLNGHSIGPYLIHGGKSVPIIKNSQTIRMEEGELYAIETFATTGRGRVVESGECSHYMRNADAGHIPLRLKSSKTLLHAIDQTFGTLAFCRRWLDDIGQTRHQMALKSLVDSHLVLSYPPLADISGSFTSQMEHTVLLRPTCKEILSRGPDY